MDLSRRELLVTAFAGATAGGMTLGSMPTVQIGRWTFSRLIVGGNPVSGNSHVSGRLSREMTDYFTAARVKQLLSDCEAAGINTWQSRGDRHIMRLLHEYRLEGGKIQWIAQTASEHADIPRNIAAIADMKPAGIYHHGSATDRFWQAGKIEEAREMLKVIRQTGVLVGLGTHIPEVIDYAESKGWDLDFYMTCLYNLSRSRQEAERLAGRPVDGELFWDPDREEMLNRVRQTPKPCLIFKVYGAGRHCDTKERMKSALRLAAGYAKPKDCFVIGMFPKYTEQVRENCRLVAEAFFATGGTRGGTRAGEPSA
ncbi:MAG: hypothetical protein HXY20_02065 [Acidobacteria bacterium]|nr:hypothetical protein [Acidobacteriota bacterium]